MVHAANDMRSTMIGCLHKTITKYESKLKAILVSTSTKAAHTFRRISIAL